MDSAGIARSRDQFLGGAQGITGARAKVVGDLIEKVIVEQQKITIRVRRVPRWAATRDP